MMKKNLGLLLLSFVLIGCTKAPTSTTNTSNATPSASTDTEPPPIKSADVVKALPQETTLAAGSSGDAVVMLQITNGYHINANPPSQPYLKATELEIKPAEGISVEFITYPDPLVKNFSFSQTSLKVYEGETRVKVRLKADKKTQRGTHNLSATLRVQACDERVCYAPGSLDLTVPVNIN